MTKDKKINVEPGKTYLGVVEDNMDPDRIGRCRVRVLDIHDGRDANGAYLMETKDLPWAMPWKDTNGNACNIPDKGKVVAIMFESGKEMNPEILYSSHYNVNLEEKLKRLGDEDYRTMKSLLFDHKTQIYVNDGEGLKLDHKFNNVNITNEGIDVNLKDNFGRINLGSARSQQRAILGDNFTQWLDTFLNLILTNQAFIGNFAAPVIPNPKMMKHIRLYKSIKEQKILSKNVYIVNNDYVEKLDRIANPTLGDNWLSTVEDNKVTSTEEVNYKSQGGASTSTFPGKTQEALHQSDEEAAKALGQKISAFVNKQEVVKDVHPDVKVLTRLLRKKNYTIYSDSGKLNIVGVRRQCLAPKDEYTDTFKDGLYVMFTDDVGEWVIKEYPFSTVPGKEFMLTEERITGKIKRQEDLDTVNKLYLNTKITTKDYYKLLAKYGSSSDQGLTVLAPSQYEDSFQIVDGGSLRTRDGAQQLVWIDKSLDKPEFYPSNMSKPLKTTRAFYITKGYPGGVNVGHWGLSGDQCFSRSRDQEDFINLCYNHQQKYGNSFTYTLVTQNDWDSAAVEQAANPKEPVLEGEKKDTPVKSYETKAETAQKPAELSTKTKVLTFQVFANKNGKKIAEDGTWGQQTAEAWNSLKTKFTKSIAHVADEEIWLGFARLFPYGGAIDLGMGKFGFKSKFNNNKFSILLTEGKKFSIFSETKNVLVSAGTYANGCLTLNVTQGQYIGKTFKDDLAWDNVRKLIS